MHYILDDKGEAQATTQDEWCKWFERANRRLEVTEIGRPPVLVVSTVFLGLDHGFLRHGGAPIVWETLVLAANRQDARAHSRYPEVGQMRRAASRTDALAAHWDFVAELRAIYEPTEATR